MLTPAAITVYTSLMAACTLFVLWYVRRLSLAAEADAALAISEQPHTTLG